ncbi:signal peptidase I [Micrococcus sp.]|uniref:signal peptidase I n=1 Tax=Micrococcus sp. TaxID=1271 RepID=UPI002A91611A|nr:signal peptidase I [Micrococcus sp.]MDY6055324.1 signal peptidase I [Micrococcus sp.]
MAHQLPGGRPETADDAGTATVGGTGSRAVGGARRGLPGWASVLLNVVVALVVVSVVQAFFVKVYSVPSGSMEQTLNVGDRMLVNRMAYPDGLAGSQDVVVFTADEAWAQPTGPDGPLEAVVKTFGDITGIGVSHEQALVKRVIGTPGQTVECCSTNGAVVVDGTPLDEPYIHQDLPFLPGSLDCTTEPRSPRCFPALTVPEGNHLVLGDHRSNSADSVIACRGLAAAGDCARFVPHEEIVGEVFATIWPPGNWGTP